MKIERKLNFFLTVDIPRRNCLGLSDMIRNFFSRCSGSESYVAIVGHYQRHKTDSQLPDRVVSQNVVMEMNI